MKTFPLMPRYIASKIVNDSVLPNSANIRELKNAFDCDVLKRKCLWLFTEERLGWDAVCDIRENIENGIADYVSSGLPEKSYLSFDRKMYRLVHDNFVDMTPSMAARHEVWNMVNVGLFPDLVVYRWKKKSGEINLERFFSPTRNYIGTMWWRIFFFYDEQSADPYWLLDSLNEDDFVQIMERVKLRGYFGLAKSIGRKIVEIREDVSLTLPVNLYNIIIRHSIIDLRVQALNLDFNGVDDVKGLVDSTFDRIRKEREREYLESSNDFNAKYKL